MVGFNGTTIAENDPLLQEISQGLVGGIVLFEKNISATNSQIKLKRLTWRMQEEAAIPLFMAIDQEGGRVNRLKSKYGFPPSVSAEYLGQQPLDSTVFYAELTAAAINPDNPIIAGVDRSYSSDPVEVAKRAAIVVKVHRDFHVATSLKHFPGHGSSKDDTHLGIADVTETWQKSELDPYKYLIEENLVDAVMSSHIVHKGLDASGNPGTLSYPIVTELLRDSLQFNGVVFTDDMQMKAITKYYGLEKSIRMALEAGVDVVIFGNNVQGSQARTVATVIKIMRDLVQEGVISEERIDASYRRIMALKRQINNP